MNGEARAGLPRLVGLLLTSPVAWALHLLVVYVLVTIECVGDWQGSTAAVYAATVLFGGASAWSGVVGWRRWRARGGPADDEREPRPFVYAMTVAGSVLFTAAILLAGATPLLTRTCVSGTLEPPLSAAPARPPT